MLIMVVMLIVLGLVGIGCPAPPEEEVLPPEEEVLLPIKVGVGTAVTGVLADDGRHHVRALEMAVDEINARGGLLGRPVELVVADVGDCTPAELVAARDLLVNAGVDMINTNWFKLPAAMTYLVEAGAEAGAFHMHHGWGLADWEQWDALRDEQPYFMVLNKGEHGYGAPWFQALTNPEMIPWEFPNKTIAILTSDSLYNRNIAQWFTEEAEKQGWEVVLHEFHPMGHLEFGPQMTMIRALDPEPAIIFINSVVSEDAIPAFAEFWAEPTNSLLITLWMVEKPEFLAAFGEQADGVLGTLPGFQFHASSYVGDNPQFLHHYKEGKAFREAYIQRWGEVPSVQAPIAYDSFWVWAEAVERVGSVDDLASIKEAMFEYPHIGLVGRYLFDRDTQGGRYGIDRVPIMYFQVQGGEVHTIALGAGRDVEHVTDFQLPYWLE